MRIQHIFILLSGTLSSVLANATNGEDANFSTSDLSDPDPQYSPQVLAGAYPYFTNEELRQLGNGDNLSGSEILDSAIARARDGGQVRKANALQRVKDLVENGGLARRDTETKSSANNGADMGSEDEDDNNGYEDEVDPDSDSGDSQEDTLVAEALEWISQFLAGQPVDENLLWESGALMADGTNDTATSEQEEPTNSSIAAMSKARIEQAVAQARLRARLQSNVSAVFEDSDAAWAEAFVNGAPLDDNFVFDSSDLHGPVPDGDTNVSNNGEASTSDIKASPSTASAAPTAMSSGGQSDDNLQKRRYKHPPKTGMQVIHRALRALHRAHLRSVIHHRGLKHKEKVYRPPHHVAHPNRYKPPHHQVTHKNQRPSKPEKPSHSIPRPGHHGHGNGQQKHKHRPNLCFNDYWSCITHCKYKNSHAMDDQCLSYTSGAG